MADFRFRFVPSAESSAPRHQSVLTNTPRIVSPAGFARDDFFADAFEPISAAAKSSSPRIFVAFRASRRGRRPRVGVRRRRPRPRTPRPSCVPHPRCPRASEEAFGLCRGEAKIRCHAGEDVPGDDGSTLPSASRGRRARRGSRTLPKADAAPPRRAGSRADTTRAVRRARVPPPWGLPFGTPRTPPRRRASAGAGRGAAHPPLGARIPLADGAPTSSATRAYAASSPARVNTTRSSILGKNGGLTIRACGGFATARSGRPGSRRGEPASGLAFFIFGTRGRHVAQRERELRDGTRGVERGAPRVSPRTPTDEVPGVEEERFDVRDDASRGVEIDATSRRRRGAPSSPPSRPCPRACRRRRYLPKTETRATSEARRREARRARAGRRKTRRGGAADQTRVPVRRRAAPRNRIDSSPAAAASAAIGSRGRPASQASPGVSSAAGVRRRARPRARTRRGGATREATRRAREPPTKGTTTTFPRVPARSRADRTRDWSADA